MVTVIYAEYGERFSGDIWVADSSSFDDRPYMIALNIIFVFYLSRREKVLTLFFNSLSKSLVFPCSASSFKPSLAYSP